MSLNIDFSQRRVFEIFITPDFAQKILDNQNKTNRRISAKIADKYARDMANGNWMENDQNKWLGFFADGNLADGQHRLRAIAVSGIGRVMRIETGLDKTQSFGIDAHRMRDTADQIKISDSETWIKKDEIAIAKLCIRAKNGSGAVPSPSDIVNYCEYHKEAMLFVRSNLGEKVRFVTVAPVHAAIFCAHGNVDEGRLSEFHVILKTGIPHSEDDHAAIRLREKMMQSAGALQSGESDRIAAIKMTMRAIKAFVDRDPIKKIFTPDNFIYPVKGMR